MAEADLHPFSLLLRRVGRRGHQQRAPTGRVDRRLLQRRDNGEPLMFRVGPRAARWALSL